VHAFLQANFQHPLQQALGQHRNPDSPARFARDERIGQCVQNFGAIIRQFVQIIVQLIAIP
jgi:hypothetical protein